MAAPQLSPAAVDFFIFLLCQFSIMIKNKRVLWARHQNLTGFSSRFRTEGFTVLEYMEVQTLNHSPSQLSSYLKVGLHVKCTPLLSTTGCWSSFSWNGIGSGSVRGWGCRQLLSAAPWIITAADTSCDALTLQQTCDECGGSSHPASGVSLDLFLHIRGQTDSASSLLRIVLTACSVGWINCPCWG